MSTQEQYLTINDFCELLSVTPKTAHRWRYRGIGPASFKAGKQVRFKRSDVEAWIEQNKCTPKNQQNEEDLDSKYEQEYADRYLLDTGAMFEADIFAGEGHFQPTNELKTCNNLLKLDIMNDWIGMLTRYYNNTFADWQEEIEEQQND